MDSEIECCDLEISITLHLYRGSNNGSVVNGWIELS